MVALNAVGFVTAGMGAGQRGDHTDATGSGKLRPRRIVGAAASALTGGAATTT